MTILTVEGEKCLLNGKATYPGKSWEGHSLEGLVLNARTIQAITDDEHPETRKLWAYPDTKAWDPERNTNEFCAALRQYRRKGLLGVTVGMQGGGSNYRPEVWNECIMTGYTPEGSLKPAWTSRLTKVLKAADQLGMIVIVNCFYWKQIRHLRDENAIIRAAEGTADWILKSGFRNVMIDVCNESADWWGPEICKPEGIAKLITAVGKVTKGGKAVPVGSSTGGDNLETEDWLAAETVSFPHGNGCTPERLVERLNAIRETAAFKKRPRPLLINEDGIDLDNMKAALANGASWGYYAQGAGSDDKGYDRLWPGGRETDLEKLSGFQTLPVNWSINDESKNEFFGFVEELTKG